MSHLRRAADIRDEYASVRHLQVTVTRGGCRSPTGTHLAVIPRVRDTAVWATAKDSDPVVRRGGPDLFVGGWRVLLLWFELLILVAVAIDITVVQQRR